MKGSIKRNQVNPNTYIYTLSVFVIGLIFVIGLNIPTVKENTNYVTGYASQQSTGYVDQSEGKISTQELGPQEVAAEGTQISPAQGTQIPPARGATVTYTFKENRGGPDRGTHYFSLPIRPTDTSIETIFSPIIRNLNWIMHDEGDNRLYYRQDGTSDFLTLEPGKGYVVNFDTYVADAQIVDELTLEVTGKPYYGFELTPLNAREDKMIGAPYRGIRLLDVKGSCELKNLKLQTTDDYGKIEHLEVNEETKLEQTKGYLIESSQDCVLGQSDQVSAAASIPAQAAERSCLECGEGSYNFCDERECKALGDNCEFTDVTWPDPNTCIEKEATAEEVGPDTATGVATAEEAAQTLTKCTITSAQIVPNCKADGDDDCQTGEEIKIAMQYKGDCNEAKFMQVWAQTEGTDLSCVISYSDDGDMIGIFDETPDIKTEVNLIMGTWPVPSIPSQCKGKKISFLSAGLFDTNPILLTAGSYPKPRSARIERSYIRTGEFTLAGEEIEAAQEQVDCSLCGINADFIDDWFCYPNKCENLGCKYTPFEGMAFWFGGICSERTVTIDTLPLPEEIIPGEVEFTATTNGKLENVKIKIEKMDPIEIGDFSQFVSEEPEQCTSFSCSTTRTYSEGQTIRYWATEYNDQGNEVIASSQVNRFTVGSDTPTEAADLETTIPCSDCGKGWGFCNENECNPDNCVFKTDDSVWQNVLESAIGFVNRDYQTDVGKCEPKTVESDTTTGADEPTVRAEINPVEGTTNEFEVTAIVEGDVTDADIKYTLYCHYGTLPRHTSPVPIPEKRLTFPNICKYTDDDPHTIRVTATQGTNDIGYGEVIVNPPEDQPTATIEIDKTPPITAGQPVTFTVGGNVDLSDVQIHIQKYEPDTSEDASTGNIPTGDIIDRHPCTSLSLGICSTTGIYSEGQTVRYWATKANKEIAGSGGEFEVSVACDDDEATCLSDKCPDQTQHENEIEGKGFGDEFFSDVASGTPKCSGDDAGEYYLANKYVDDNEASATPGSKYASCGLPTDCVTPTQRCMHQGISSEWLCSNNKLDKCDSDDVCDTVTIGETVYYCDDGEWTTSDECTGCDSTTNTCNTRILLTADTPQENMCGDKAGANQYYAVRVPANQQCKITWELGGMENDKHMLYAEWEGVCGTTFNWVCQNTYGLFDPSVGRSCVSPDYLPAGTYHAWVRYGSPYLDEDGTLDNGGTYNIKATLVCE